MWLAMKVKSPDLRENIEIQARIEYLVPTKALVELGGGLGT